MGTQVRNDIAASDRIIMGCLAGMIMFIAGYTVSRVTLSQTSPAGNLAAENTVIPHQGEMWRAFGE